MQYAGICRGGPCEGERIAHNAPWFRRAEWPGTPYVDANGRRVHAYNWDYQKKEWHYVG